MLQPCLVFFNNKNAHTHLTVVSPSDSAHLHLRPLWWGDLGVVDLDLSFWHLVQSLVHDPQGLPHLLHSAQISAAHTKQSAEEREELSGETLRQPCVQEVAGVFFPLKS